jgi:hypothetical protein
MIRSKVWFATAFALITVLSCHKNADRERVLLVPLNPWGVDFKFPPISERPLAEQEMGKATFLVDEGGGGASGFFISPDGLALTNEHVLSRESCSKTCQGIRLIRHFTPNGAFEIFSKFEILAQSSRDDLDFALIKVSLPPGVTVPFLKMKDGSNLPYGSGRLRVLGHPALASLRSSEAHPADSGKNPRALTILGPTVPGNSGGPLVDVARREVIGITHGYIHGFRYINRVPSIVLRSRAIRIDAVKEAIGRLYPKTRGVAQWNLSLFDPRDMAPKATLPVDLVPKDREVDFFRKPITDVGVIVRQFMNLKEPLKEKEALLNFLDVMEHRSTASLEITDAAYTLVHAALKRNKKLEMDDTVLRQFSNLARPEDRREPSMLDALEILQDGPASSRQVGCLNRLDAKGLETEITNAGTLCVSDKLANGNDVFHALVQQFHGGKDTLLPGSSPVIRQQATLRLLTGDQNSGEVSAALKILSTTYEKSPDPVEGLSAEGLYTLLQHGAHLLVKGAFQDSFSE